MKLSISMIVKNEENNIERTLVPLKQLQNYIDCEIIIVDTGSTDNTIDIAKRYTDKIYLHEWNDSFSDMRNISIGYCTGDWILVVDADEVLYDINGLVTLFKNEKLNKYSAAHIKIVNYYNNVDDSINKGYVSPLLRIFKRGTIFYEGIVHEQPRFQYPVLDTNIRFIHYGYDSSDYELMEYKYKRNLSLLFEELKNEPDSIYINFQIAVSYSMHKELKESLKYIEKAYIEAKKEISKHIYVIDKYCFILYRMKEYKLLLEKAKEGIKHCTDFIDFYFYVGESYFNLNDYENAIKAYNKYLHYCNKFEENITLPNNTLSVITRGLKNNVLYNLAICYYTMNLYQKAINNINEIQDKDILKNNIYFILKIVIEGKLWSEVSYLNEFVDKYNYEQALCYAYNEILLEDLCTLNERLQEGRIKDIFCIVKDFKENGSLNKRFVDKAKEIINIERIPYSIYIYYILKFDINQIKDLMIYGKDKIENVLLSLSTRYFEFNDILLKGLDEIKADTFDSIIIRAIIERALILGGKLPSDQKKYIFLNYIAEKYYSIVKLYNQEIITNSNWMLSSEERFIVKLKNALQYRYDNSLKYIRDIRNILNIENNYAEYIKLLVDEEQDIISTEIKSLIPELVIHVKELIDKQKYQEAYDAIEQALSLVKFNFDLMVLKYSLLLKFNYEKEARQYLRDIILYGNSESVIELINNL